MPENPGGIEAQTIEDTIAEDERSAYRSQIEQLLARGYLPSLELAEAGYTMLQIRRIRATLEAERIEGRPSSNQTLRAMGDLQSLLKSQLVGLDKRQASTGDPDQDLRLAEQWVQEHLGEFQDRCPSCGLMLTVPALPHWALAPITIPDQPAPLYMVWSPELWALVLDGTISLWVMALVLRTSPEALKITAERRGEPWPEIDLEVEEAALAIRLKIVDRQLLSRTRG